MKRLCLILGLIVVLFASTWASNNELWRVFPAGRYVDKVAYGNGDVYALAEGSLFVYNEAENSVRTISRLDGLSDGTIIHSAYSNDVKVLVLVYDNGNIDIIEGDKVYTMPDLAIHDQLRDKTINDLVIKGSYAYLATNFGILVINLSKKEFKESYILNVQALKIDVDHRNIVFLNNEMLYWGFFEDNLFDISNWHKSDISSLFSPNDQAVGVAVIEKTAYFGLKNRGIFSCEIGQNPLSFKSLPGIHLLKKYQNKLIALTEKRLEEVNLDGNLKGFSLFGIKDFAVYPKGYWLAAGEQGVVSSVKNADSYRLGTPIKFNGPSYNSAFQVVKADGILYAIPGGRSDNSERFGKRGDVMVYKNGQWNNILREQVAKKFNVWPRDFLSIAVDPLQKNRFFVASYGDGLFEYQNDQPETHYNHTNSPIEIAEGGKGNPSYQFVSGLAFDEKGTLWMANSEVRYALKALDKTGKWYNFYCPDISYSGGYTVEDVLVTKSGAKWINIPRVNPGIAIYDDKGTLEDKSDDQYKFYKQFTDQSNKIVDVTGYYCMAQDLLGTIWVGTNRGPLIFYRPEQAFSTSFRCTRIVVGEAQHEGYLLENIKVTAIAIDAFNRKWLGTDNDGVYLLSDDGQVVLQHWTVANSPMPSNFVYSIYIDETGEAFIGTEKGLVSYRGEKNQSGRSGGNQLHVYPNPLRPEMPDRIHISGFEQGSILKITDLSGNLIFEQLVRGSSLLWDARNSKGERVATGIYLVLVAKPDGSDSSSTKIMIVR